MAFLLPLAAIKAASLHIFAISAPEKPGVCCAKNLILTSSDNFNGFMCTSKISFLSLISGKST